MQAPPLTIGIVCDPGVVGSGILATRLGAALARRGHEVHFISHARPFALPRDLARVHVHRARVQDSILFKYPDYTLPLSVKIAEVACAHHVDVLHVHYAVPNATAALLARAMIAPPRRRPQLVTTLHGTDALILGRDPTIAPAIRHALEGSAAVTAVSAYLAREARRLLDLETPIDVIHNFFVPRAPKRSREEVRRELGIADDQAMLIHLSNARPVKRIDVLLEAAARIRPVDAFKLVILAGDDFTRFAGELRRLGLEGRVIVRERVDAIEDYLQAADLGLFASDTESFCLAILEAMWFSVPSVATDVGGIPEVLENGTTGLLAPCGDPERLARAAEGLIRDTRRRTALGRAAYERACRHFSGDVIVPRYEALYRRCLDSDR